MPIIEGLVNFIRGLFSPEQWAQIGKFLADTLISVLDHGLDVALLVVLILATTQIIKMFMRRAEKLPDPSNPVIHSTSVLSSALWSFTLFPDDKLPETLAAAIVAWFVAYLIATYGLRYLRARSETNGN